MIPVLTKPAPKAPIITLYGPPGSWKTEFAIRAGAVIAQTENGLGDRAARAVNLQTATSPDGKLLSASDKIQYLKDLIREIGTTENDVPALAIDSLDHLEAVVAQSVCEEGGKSSIEDFGFGKGHDRVAERVHDILKYLERLRNRRNIPIILLCHAKIVTVTPLDGSDPYDRYTMKLGKKSNALVQEMSDIIAGSIPKVTVVKSENGKTRAVGDGSYIMTWADRPGHEGKCRYRLPKESCRTSWDEFWSIFSVSREVSDA